jgi:tripartite-type tricarboxylate transporter receptor subunit TctC
MLVFLCVDPHAEETLARPRNLKMTSLRLFIGICLTLTLPAPFDEAAAQSYPDKHVRLITAAAGAASDFVSRMVAAGLTELWGQAVVIDNRGGSAVIPIELVAKAPPDGYTLLAFGSALWHLPLMLSVSYDPIKDLAPITLVATTPLIAVVHPTLPVNSIKELIALAKSRPGQLNYSSGIAGSATHLTTELFKAMAGIDLVRVSYKGGAPALNALLSAETQVMFANASGGGPHAKSGRLRALAVTSARRSALFPELPTVAEAGVPGYESTSTQCIFAPGATPVSLVNRLNRDLVMVLSKAEVKERFLRVGSEIVASSPDELATVIKADTVRIGNLIKQAGIGAN